jgi:hypothetical protein
MTSFAHSHRQKLIHGALACLMGVIGLTRAAPESVRATGMASRVGAQPEQAFTPPQEITLTMMRLNEPSGTSTGVLCTPGDTSFGCRSGGAPYPYATNPITIPIETDYLLDVVPSELGMYYHPLAIEAQVIAARSYAYWNINNGSRINNSVSFQAFLPGKFEGLGTLPDIASSPCASGNLSSAQRTLCRAMGPPRYLSLSTNTLPMFTEFSADIENRTRTGSRPGLNAVDDPISSGCDANFFGHGRGMSQEGASRWGRGDRCSYTSRGSDPWSVRWTRTEQILVHYYTNAQLRDVSANPLLSGLRWNPLRIDGIGRSLAPNRDYVLRVQLQNTGVLPWACSGAVVSYTLGYRWVISSENVLAGSGASGVPCELARGDPSPMVTLPITDVPQISPTKGISLVIDMREHYDDGSVIPFAVSGWQPYTLTLDISANLTTDLWLPLVLR